MSLEILGHSCTIEPLLIVEQVERIERLKTFSGVLLTSSNAIAPLKSLYSKYEREILPVLTTGSATAEQARNAGFCNIEHVQGSALDLVKVVPQWMRKNKIAQDESLFYPSAERTAHNIPALLEAHKINCRGLPVYRTVPRTEFSKETKRLLQNEELDAVLLYSSRTAQTFTKLLHDNNLSLPTIKIFALSKEIAHFLLGQFSDRVYYPTKPAEDDLLALLN